MTDVDGNVLLDFAAVSLVDVGHAHPHVVEARQEQASRFIHTDFTIVPYAGVGHARRTALAVAPFTGPAKAAFDAGTEAVENAVEFRAHTRNGGGDRVRRRVPWSYADVADADVETHP